MWSLANFKSSHPVDGITWIESAGMAWERIWEHRDTVPPGAWEDWPAELVDAESMEKISAKDRLWIASNHGFMMSCAMLTYVGLMGWSLLQASVSLRGSFWLILLRNAGIGGLILTYYLFYGFNINYPSGESGWDILAAYFLPALPDSSDPVDYGMMGLTMWSDCFYQAAFAMLPALILASFCPAGLRTAPLAVVGLLIGFWGFPILSSFQWGGGWLSVQGALDFSGSAIVHLLTGAAALPIAFGLSMTRHRRAHMGLPPLPIQDHPKVGYELAAAVFLVLAIIGWHAGSVLEAHAELVVSVLKITFVSGGVAASIGLAAGVLPQTRQPLQLSILCGLTGFVLVSGTPDTLTLPIAIGTGVIGAIITIGTLLLLDLARIPDPLGVIPVHFMGGLLGTVLPALPFAATSDQIAAPLLAQGQLLGSAITMGFLISAVVVAGFTLFNHLDQDLPTSAASHSNSSASNPYSRGGTPPPLPKS